MHAAEEAAWLGQAVPPRELSPVDHGRLQIAKPDPVEGPLEGACLDIGSFPCPLSRYFRSSTGASTGGAFLLLDGTQ